MFLRILPTRHLHVGKRNEQVVVVVAHALGIVVNNFAQLRQLVLDVDRFVNLLLILSHHHDRIRVVDDVFKLMTHRILVQRHRHTAQGLYRHHRPVYLRPIVADNRQLVPRLKP